MLTELLQTLTPDQKRELRTLGITDQLRSNWLAGRNYPSVAQATILEVMCKLPAGSLRDWLAVEKATPEQKEWLTKHLGKGMKKAAATVAALLISTGIAVAQLAWLPGEPRFFRPRKRANV